GRCRVRVAAEFAFARLRAVARQGSLPQTPTLFCSMKSQKRLAISLRLQVALHDTDSLFSVPLPPTPSRYPSNGEECATARVSNRSIRVKFPSCESALRASLRRCCR